MTSADVMTILKKQGWIQKRVKGSHYQFSHPERPGLVTVPHPRKDIKQGTLMQIWRQAGVRPASDPNLSGAIMFYPAYIHSDADGSASGFFPDVPGCYFAGESLDEAFQDARSALNVHFETLCEMNEVIPNPGPVENHLEAHAEDFKGGQWLLVDINMNQFDGRAERINITLPRRLLVKIDSFVREHPRFSNRSAFLAEAARRVLLG